MMVVHWGNTNSKHNHSTTAYLADNWDKISSDRRGSILALILIKILCFLPGSNLMSML
jgi:hypothetical protein